MIKNNKAFTFVETILAVAITTSMVTALYMVLFTGTDSWEVNNKKLELQQELRFVMANLRDDFMQTNPG